jgi:type VI secretion system protein ImpG
VTAAARTEQRDYFLRELEALRVDGAAFAAQHPRLAGALDISADGTADPHVERLIEAFAFLTGRIQRNLDHQLPRLASALLSALYPHLTAPIPSLAIAELSVDPARARAAHGFKVPRGAELTAETNTGAVLRFRTTWDVELWPIRIAAVDRPDPAQLAFLDGRGDVRAVLRLRLAALGGERFADLAPKRLRLRLAAPLAMATSLYETLSTRTREIWAVDPAAGASPVPLEGRATGPARRLSGAAIAPVGFAPEEAALPHPPNAHHSHRLIQEYFTFPDKFLFLDITGLDAAAGAAKGGWFDLVFIVDAGPAELAPAEGGTLRLGSVPIVNLFSRVSEPIRIDRARIEQLVTPDARLERSTEIHAIRRVTLSSASPGAGNRLAPFFGIRDGDGDSGSNAIGWIARRAPCRRLDMGGTDMLIAFRDHGFEPARPAADVAFAHLACTNRGLAEHLPAGARLGLERDAPVKTVVCATRPTPQADAPAAGADLWRLIAHLSANQLAFADGPEALAALRTHLGLYCSQGARSAQRQVAGLRGLATRRISRRVGEDAWRGFCRGVELTATLDETHFAGASGYLFGAVLARFLAVHAAPSAFTELVLRSVQREGEWVRWPPMVGEAVLA